MLKLKLHYYGHLIGRSHSLKKSLMLGTAEGRRRREDETVGWHDGVNGHEFEQTRR